MDKKKEINNVENQNPYEGIDENIVKFVKAIEFYDDYGSHMLCTENCKECKFHPLCEYRGEINVNLALHLIDAGYGHIPTALNEYLHSNVKAAAMIDSIVIIKQREAVKEFSENAVKPIIDELVELLFNDDVSSCKVDNCEKGSDIPCGSSICIDENKRYWKRKVDKLIKEVYGDEEDKN